MGLGKHFINGVPNAVVCGLHGIASQDASLRVIDSQKILYRQQKCEKVLLLSGGGSGHEPAHAGYVGDGMLDICVAGEIFASPSATQILAGLRALPSPKGVLMIVKNYTGDKLNFGLAAQRAKVLGIQVNVVFVGDDVSVEGNDLVGQRGLAGAVFVHKVAGAAARAGKSLEEVTEVAQKAADSLITGAVSLGRCNVPNREPTKDLPQDELEYGMGIHNEPGVSRAAIPSLSITISTLREILRPAIRLPSSKRFAVMINNLGGLSVLELHVVADEILSQLIAEGLDIRRVLIGTFVTSLDAPGFSVTLLGLDDQMEQLINENTTVTAWPNALQTTGLTQSRKTVVVEAAKIKTSISVTEIETETPLPVSPQVVLDILNSIVASVIKDEPMITHFDTIAGDGDCGETLLNGVKATATALQPFLTDSVISLYVLFRVLAVSVESSTGGTSGAIYAIFFNALYNGLPSQSTAIDGLPTTTIIANALSSALTQLYQYTSARRGHKTLMDALIPFVKTFYNSLDLNVAIKAAAKGAENTRSLKAVMGRASYVGESNFSVKGGVPDPGALGIVSVLKGIERGLVCLKG